MSILPNIGFFLFAFFHIAVILYCLAYIYALQSGNYLMFIALLIFNLCQPLFQKNHAFIKLFRMFNIRKYFESWDIITEEPVAKTKSLFIAHPHGIYTMGLLFNLNDPTNFFKDLIVCGSRVQFFVPFGGLMVRLWGIQSADPHHFSKLMKEKNNVALVPGGFEEATLTNENEMRLYLKQRKGFIKYALRFGYKVHPLITFNENKLFKNSSVFMSFRIWLNKFKIPSVIFAGRLGPFIPVAYPIKVMTVVGKGIQFPTIENPSAKEINEYHDLYVNNVYELFDKYKGKFEEKQKLVIY